jgi:hypothetical protein
VRKAVNPVPVQAVLVLDGGDYRSYRHRLPLCRSSRASSQSDILATAGCLYFAKNGLSMAAISSG